MGSFADRVRKLNAARTAVPPQQETAPSTAPSSNPPPSTQITASPSAAATEREQVVISQSHVRKRYAIIEEVLTQQRSPPSAADLPIPQAAPPPAEARLTQAELYQSFKARVRNTSTLAGGAAPTTSYYPAVETAAAVGPRKPAAGSKKAGPKNKSPAQRKRKQNPSPAVMLGLTGDEIQEDEAEEVGRRRVKVRKTADPAYLLDSEQEDEDEEEDEEIEIVSNGGKNRPQRQQQQQSQQQRRNGAKKQVKESGISASPPALRSFDAIFSTQVATEEDKEEEEEEERSEGEGDLEERKGQKVSQAAAHIPVTTTATTAAAAVTAALLEDAPPEFRLRFDEDGNEILPREIKTENPQEQTEEPENDEEEEEEAYLDLAVPGSIAKYLRPYQHAGIRFLLQNYARGRGALLADDMGLGKTLQTIAFLSAVLGKTGDARVDSHFPVLPQLERFPRSNEGAIDIRDDFYEPDYSSGAPNLIVCPTSLLDNWLAEFNKWGKFRVSKLGRTKDIDSGLNSLLKGTTEVGITSFSALRGNVDKFSLIPWHVVVFDEAHNLKNPKASQSQAAAQLPTRLRFALTGTPMANDYSELFHLMDLIIPGILGDYETYFKKVYEDKMKHGMRKDATEDQLAEGAEAQENLTQILRPVMLRRTKAIIAHQLPKKRDNIVFCQLAPLQMKVYKRALQLPDVQNLILKAREECPCGSGKFIYKCKGPECPKYWTLTYEQGGVLYPHFHFCECDNAFDSISNPTGCKTHRPDGCFRLFKGELIRICPFCLLMPLMTLLRKISLHLDLVKANPDDEKTDPRKFNWDKEVAESVFGTDAEALRGYIQSSRHLEMTTDISMSCGKLAALKGLLTKWAADVRGSGGLPHKVLVFSNSVRMLKIVRKMVENAGWDSLYLTGETPQQDRQPMVDSFNKPSSTAFIFIVSTGAGGVGLNLTGANKVVILDPSYSPAADLQAMDRAFRIGQKRDVDVYRLVAAGTIEERIYMRQISKQQHSNVVVDGAGPQKRLFTGVKGDRYQKGDLWGFENMLGSLLRDEAERVEAMEAVGDADEEEEGGSDDQKLDQGASGSGSGSGTARRGGGGAFVIEQVPEEVTAELERAAAASAAAGVKKRRGGGGGGGGVRGGDVEDGFDPGLEAALLQEEADAEVLQQQEEQEIVEDATTAATAPPQQQQQQQQQENNNLDDDDDEALNMPGVLGIVAHTMAMAPSKKEEALHKSALAALRQKSTKAEKEESLALAASSVAVPASFLECLAAWRQTTVKEMAREMLDMSKEERRDLIHVYCESAPKEGLFPT